MDAYPTYWPNDNEPTPKFTYDSIKEVGLQVLPEVEVFKHADFNFQINVLGLTSDVRQHHIDEDKNQGYKTSLRTTFDVDLAGHSLNQNISSIIVYSGYWQFFSSDGTTIPHIFGPGHYPSVEAFGIRNDTISSFKSVAGMQP